MTRTEKTLRPRRLPGMAAATVFVLLAGIGSMPLSAQEPSATDPGKPGEAAPTQAPASSATPGEGFQWGVYEGRSEIEIGYRWVTDIAGNRDMYRSMVNLGDGPKLLRSDISLRSAYGSAGLFDRLDFSMYSWGGEPYNTLRFTLGRSDLYELRANYRNQNYFNYIPSHANPLFAGGVLLGQHSLNITYRTTDVELELFPNGRIRPYVGYSRATSFGPGLSTYSLTGNEFRLNTDWRHAADEYRGGLQVALPRLNFTLEQGYRFLRNDTGTVDAGLPGGNNPIPFLGRPISLDSQERAYRERTRVPVTKILAKARPFKALSITGRYIYSMAEIESSLAEFNSGNLVSLENRLAYASAADAFTGRATRPNHRGNLIVEFSPTPGLKIINHFDTRNYHVSGSALLGTTFFNARSLLGPGGGAGSDVSVAEEPVTRLVFDQTRNST
ncbi:MAG: hypothetical protein ABIG68_01525, partial [Acidobacteriota bacterium]